MMCGKSLVARKRILTQLQAIRMRLFGLRQAVLDSGPATPGVTMTGSGPFFVIPPNAGIQLGLDLRGSR